jgi:hypothetical protein
MTHDTLVVTSGDVHFELTVQVNVRANDSKERKVKLN